MKSTFKIGAIEIQGVKLENIEFTQEYTASEAIQSLNAGKKFVQDLIKELPEMLEDLGEVTETAVKLSDKFESPMFNCMHMHGDMSNLRAMAEKPESLDIVEMLKAMGLNPSYVKVVRTDNARG